MLIFPGHITILRTKYEVCILLWTRAPRFKGFRQQDSQELLRYLLDSVRTEEIKVRYLSELVEISSPKVS